MNEIKKEVKDTVQDFTRRYTSSVVKESTKKLLNGLDKKQKETLESSLMDISDDQLERYIENNPGFKNALENTIKSVNDIRQEKTAGSVLENLQSAYEASFVEDIAKISTGPVQETTPGIKIHGDIKKDVKDTVWTFTREYTCGAVKESTKKLLKNLDNKQKARLKSRLKNMSDDQLERYIENNVDFQKALENTITSVNDISPEKTPRSFMDNLQSAFEASFARDMAKILLGQSLKIIPTVLVLIVLMLFVGYVLGGFPSAVPRADFSSNTTEGYSPLSVQFTDQSENAASLSWDFGDGAFSTEKDPVHTYSSAGTYTIKLTASDGKKTDSKLKTITVMEDASTITWNNPDDITYGTRLSDKQLNAEASIQGTFTYTPGPGTLLGAGTQILHADFTPADAINDNSVSRDVYINVLKAVPEITWNNPADITNSMELSNDQLNAVATVPGTYVYTPAPRSVLDPGIQTLYLDFTPTDSLNYTMASKSVTINVLEEIQTKEIPAITWYNPDDITYGTELSSRQLNAKASVQGTFSYSPESGTVLNPGTQTLHVDFTPADSTNYTTASKDVIINVLKITPDITWVDYTDSITYGTRLSRYSLTAESSVPGSFVYTPPIGTVLGAGTQTLHVDFTPEDTAKYNTASMDVPIIVLKATPEITWNNPEDRIVGTKLGSDQLNAIASVPGSFDYNPPEGTELTALGENILRVNFTPRDITNYTTVSKEVTIYVYELY